MKGINDGNLHIIVSQQCNGGKQYDFQGLLGVGSGCPFQRSSEANKTAWFLSTPVLARKKGFPARWSLRFWNFPIPSWDEPRPVGVKQCVYLKEFTLQQGHELHSSADELSK